MVRVFSVFFYVSLRFYVYKLIYGFVIQSMCWWFIRIIIVC